MCILIFPSKIWAKKMLIIFIKIPYVSQLLQTATSFACCDPWQTSQQSFISCLSHVPAAPATLQCPQTAVSVVVIVADSVFIVVPGKSVGLMQATPTWIKVGVPASIAFNSTIHQMSTSVLSIFLWGI